MLKHKRLKSLTIITGIAVALITLLITGCSDKVETTQKYTKMEPVYMSPAELRSSFEVTAPREVANTGKIYLYQNYILLNEPGEGIHIINNEDKENPEMINFINIPGNYEMAVQGDRLFADSYLDLLVLDISDPSKVSLSSRLEDIFLQMVQGNEFYDEEQGILVDWEPVEVIEKTEGDFESSFPSYYFYDTGIAFRGQLQSADMALSSFAPESAPIMQTGIGGSMARFTIMKEHLYAIDHSNMTIFDIQDLDNPVPGAVLNIGWGIETIFPYQDNLFIGSQSGMIIYDNSNPNFPTHLSTFEHIVSCDPVVVEGNTAYVTLRGGSGCRNGFTNQLDVIDITDLTQPKLIKTYPMTNPHGLGIDNGLLFICEGDAGLKVFDASNDLNITDHLLAYFGEIHAYDVIPYQGNLIMIGEDGLYQFNYSDPEDIQFSSMIPINRTEAAF